uniref:Putative secreted protein n=1 Tax=Anopheles darlingi TaxID=43151 RepID=A0A2M4DC02_ANODA
MPSNAVMMAMMMMMMMLLLLPIFVFGVSGFWVLARGIQKGNTIIGRSTGAQHIKHNSIKTHPSGFDSCAICCASYSVKHGPNGYLLHVAHGYGGVINCASGVFDALVPRPHRLSRVCYGRDF